MSSIWKGVSCAGFLSAKAIRNRGAFGSFLIVRVKQRDPLVVLEPTTSSADVDELKVRLASLKADVAVFEAILENADHIEVVADAKFDDQDLMDRADARFHSQRERIKSHIRSQRELVIQREQEIREVNARLKYNTTALDIVREQIQISKKLLKLKLTNRMEHLAILREEVVLSGRLEEDDAALPRTRAAKNEAQARMKAIEIGFREEAQKELEKAQRGIKELSRRLLKYEDSLYRTVLRSPVDGTIKTLNAFTVGGVIRPGSTVVEVVPADDLLIVEARLPPQDIAYVQPGQTAVVRLTSVDAMRFGDLSGEVMQVSPDTLVTKDGVPFYKVRIKTERSYFQNGEFRHDLFPGMQVQCSIQTGSRTVLEYLFEPYMVSLKGAMSER